MSTTDRTPKEIAPGEVELHRIDPACRMARFYALRIEGDLFGHVVLVRAWGRIGTASRERRDRYASEADALTALLALAERKMRRGYRPVES